MKKIFLILFVNLIVFTSCENDLVSAPPSDSTEENGNSGGTDVSGDLLGSWQMISFNYTGTTVTTVQGITLTADFVGVASDIDYVIEFTETPNNFSATGGYDLELTTTSSGQSFVENVEDLNVSSNGTWSKNNNTIVFTETSEDGEATIEILNDTTLKFTQIVDENINQQGVESTVNTNNVYIFERL